MKIAISAESTVDLTQELKEQYGIKTVPFGVCLGDRNFKDGEISTQEIFDYVEETGILPKTNAVNEFDYEEHFGDLLKENDAIIHISLSSEISSACSNAKAVASRLKNVYVIDSLSLSTGIALLAIYAANLAKQTDDPAEIARLCEKRVPYVQASFVLERLDYLYKGGRCSALQLFGANLLKLRPQILVAKGKMAPHKKYRGGMPGVVQKYCEDTLEQFDNPDKSLVFITHSRATEAMVASARAVLEEHGFTNIQETIAGCTISSHCGKNCLGILYINDGGNSD